MHLVLPILSVQVLEHLIQASDVSHTMQHWRKSGLLVFDCNDYSWRGVLTLWMFFSLFSRRLFEMERETIFGGVQILFERSS